MSIFTDLTGRILINKKKTITLPLKELQSWLDNRIDSKTLVGYGNEKFDHALLTDKHNVKGNPVDFSEMVTRHRNFTMEIILVGIRPQNHPLESQEADSHHSSSHSCFKPIALISEWQRGMMQERGVESLGCRGRVDCQFIQAHDGEGGNQDN